METTNTLDSAATPSGKLITSSEAEVTTPATAAPLTAHPEEESAFVVHSKALYDDPSVLTPELPKHPVDQAIDDQQQRSSSQDGDHDQANDHTATTVAQPKAGEPTTSEHQSDCIDDKLVNIDATRSQSTYADRTLSTIAQPRSHVSDLPDSTNTFDTGSHVDSATTQNDPTETPPQSMVAGEPTSDIKSYNSESPFTSQDQARAPLSTEVTATFGSGSLAQDSEVLSEFVPLSASPLLVVTGPQLQSSDTQAVMDAAVVQTHDDNSFSVPTEPEDDATSRNMLRMGISSTIVEAPTTPQHTELVDGDAEHLEVEEPLTTPTRSPPNTATLDAQELPQSVVGSSAIIHHENQAAKPTDGGEAESAALSSMDTNAHDAAAANQSPSELLSVNASGPSSGTAPNGLTTIGLETSQDSQRVLEVADDAAEGSVAAEGSANQVSDTVEAPSNTKELESKELDSKEQPAASEVDQRAPPSREVDVSSKPSEGEVSGDSNVEPSVAAFAPSQTTYQQEAADEADVAEALDKEVKPDLGEDSQASEAPRKEEDDEKGASMSKISGAVPVDEANRAPTFADAAMPARSTAEVFSKDSAANESSIEAASELPRSTTAKIEYGMSRPPVSEPLGPVTCVLGSQTQELNVEPSGADTVVAALDTQPLAQESAESPAASKDEEKKEITPEVKESKDQATTSGIEEAAATTPDIVLSPATGGDSVLVEEKVESKVKDETEAHLVKDHTQLGALDFECVMKPGAGEDPMVMAVPIAPGRLQEEMQAVVKVSKPAAQVEGEVKVPFKKKREPSVFTSKPVESKADASAYKAPEVPADKPAIYTSKPEPAVVAASAFKPVLSPRTSQTVFVSKASKSFADASALTPATPRTQQKAVYESNASPSRADVTARDSVHTPTLPEKTVFESEARPSNSDAGAYSPAPLSARAQRALYESQASPSNADATATSPHVVVQKKSVFVSQASPSVASVRHSDETPMPKDQGVFESKGLPSTAHARATDEGVKPAEAVMAFVSHPMPSIADVKSSDPPRVMSRGMSGMFVNDPEPSRSEAKWDASLHVKQEKTIFESTPKVERAADVTWKDPALANPGPPVFVNTPAPSMADTSASRDVEVEEDDYEGEEPVGADTEQATA